MRSEWIDLALGDVLTLQRGFDLPQSERIDGPVPVIASTGEVGRHNEAKVAAPGVVIGRSGSLGGGQYIREPYWPLNTTLWVKDFKGNDPRFCYYLIKSLDFTGYNAGSGVPTLNRNHIHPLPVRIPAGVGEQHAIAQVLGALDDKIELNERMNATLDEMARTLFKSWFVDFDPVRAKAEGRQPSHMDAATVALFPASFEDSALGPIPAGWRVSTVGDEFSVTMGQSPPGESYNEEGDGLPFFQGRRDFGFRFPGDRVYCTDPRRLAEAGDTLVSVRAPVGDLNVAPAKCCIGRGVAAVRHRSGSIAYTFHNMVAIRDQMIEYEAGGTVFGSINKKDMAALTVVTPSPALVEVYTDVAGPLEALIQLNWGEASVLAGLRDALLPKLIAGELRVGDAERAAEAVGVAV